MDIAMTNKLESMQSILDSRLNKSSNQSIIDNRVKGLHTKLCSMLNDSDYNIGHTYKIAKRFSDYDIYNVADYCSRKANRPGRAFVAIFQKKLNQL